tara:strand:- start:62 stop:268 length:207 start_codon:yes stop_codon:yes gene_type:complete
MAEKTPAQRLIEIEEEQKAIEAKMEDIDDHMGDGDRNMEADEKELKELQAKWNALDEEKNKLLQPLRF